MDLGSMGLWSRQLRFGDRGRAIEASAELEELGYGALWIPGGLGGDDLVTSVEGALTVTTRVVVATGILNVWGHAATDVATDHSRLDRAHPGRFLLGLGVGHAPFVADYRRPLEAMTAFLDTLDANGAPRTRVLAALAPRMLAMARERTLGAHPYMVPVEHTAFAREELGRGVLLAPELSVVLAPKVDAAAEIARRDLQLYLGLPNYVSAWRRLGYRDGDTAAGGSDRLVHALYALGTVDAVERRVRDHLAAGADHVCVRVITGRADDDTHLSLEEWRRLGPVARALNRPSSV